MDLNYDLKRPVDGYAPPHVRINGESTRIGAGPPLLSNMSKSNTTPTTFKDTGDSTVPGYVYPLGIIQNLNISQNKHVMSLSEIGSRRNFMFPGKSVGAVSFGRAWVYGPNLLRLLYAYYSDIGDKMGENGLLKHTWDQEAGTNAENKTGYSISPGYKNMWLNLESDVFDHPIGLLMVVKDTMDSYIGAQYLETAYITSASHSTDANGMMTMEGVNLLYEQMVPVKIASALSITDAKGNMQHGNATPKI